MYKSLLWSVPLKNCDHIWEMSIGYSDRKFPDHVGPILWGPWPNYESSDITSWFKYTATAIVVFLYFSLGYVRAFLSIGHWACSIKSIKMNITNQGLFEAATEMMPDVFFFSFLEAERSTVSSSSFFRFVNPACHHHHAQQWGQNNNEATVVDRGAGGFVNSKHCFEIIWETFMFCTVVSIR